METLHQRLSLRHSLAPIVTQRHRDERGEPGQGKENPLSAAVKERNAGPRKCLTFATTEEVFLQAIEKIKSGHLNFESMHHLQNLTNFCQHKVLKTHLYCLILLQTYQVFYAQKFEKTLCVQNILPLQDLYNNKVL